MTLKVKIDGEFQPISGGEAGEISGDFLPGSTAGYPAGVEALSLDNQDVTGDIGSYAFYGHTSLTSLTLPAGLTGDIGMNAFYGCTSLTDLTLPAGLTGSIGSNAFFGCTSLTSLTLPPGMTGSIGSNAFRGCTSLTDLTLPPGLTGSIGSYAFYGCTSLTSLTLPPGMTGSIGSYAFRGCTSLEDLNLMSPTVMSLDHVNAFFVCPAIIRVPSNLVASYKTATNWSQLADRIFPIED